MGYIKRKYLRLLKEYLTYFPCVVVLGPRQCGKTTLLQALGEQWTIFDLERNSDFQIISQDPELFLRMNGNRVAMDEAQRLPELFSALRVAIDQERGKAGRFILTGSSSPDLRSSISESLAGRVGIIEMSPLLLSEIYPSPGGSVLQGLLEPGSFLDNLPSRQSHTDLHQIHEYWFRGGYPEPWLKNDPRFQELWFEQYVTTYLERDISQLFPSLNRQRFRLFVQMLAGLSGNILNYSQVARTLGVSQPTVKEYFEIAHGTYLWRQLAPYEKNVNKRIVKHPKGYLRDSGLLHHLLRIQEVKQLLSHPNFGFSWEAMVIEEILRGLNCLGVGFDYYYYRTAKGAEIDLIIESKYGLIPIEIKYHQSISLHQLRGIREFIHEKNCPFGLLINNEEKVRFYDETLIGLPFSHLI